MHLQDTRRMLNVILFAACFSYRTSLIALVATDCPCVLIQSYWKFLFKLNTWASFTTSRIRRLFPPRLFALSLLQLEVDSIHINYCFKRNIHFQAIHSPPFCFVPMLTPVMLLFQHFLLKALVVGSSLPFSSLLRNHLLLLSRVRGQNDLARTMPPDLVSLPSYNQSKKIRSAENVPIRG